MKKSKKHLVSALSGCLIGVIVFLISINVIKPQVHYDYPFYFTLEEVIQHSNKIVIGEVIAYEGVKVLDVGDGARKYCICRIKVSETISGDATSGDEILVRIFELDNADDHPFEVGSNYICFLWDIDEFPAVLLNRSQSQMRIEGEDLFLTNDTYTAVEGTASRLRNNQGITLQTENISDDLYEDVILKNAKQQILTTLRDLTTK